MKVKWESSSFLSLNTNHFLSYISFKIVNMYIHTDLSNPLELLADFLHLLTRKQNKFWFGKIWHRNKHFHLLSSYIHKWSENTYLLMRRSYLKTKNIKVSE